MGEDADDAAEAGETTLKGRVVIVTGGGSGVGRATAVALSGAGAAAVVVGRREEALRRTVAVIEERGGRAAAIAADVSDEAAVAGLVDRVGDEFGGIDGIVLAAGIGVYGPVEEYSLADWNATLATNLTGTFLCARAVIGPMRRQGGGAIVAIASGAEKQGYANLAAYAASKFGLLGLMQSLAAEVGEAGIKVSTVVPGSIVSGFAGRDAAAARTAADPTKRYLEPEDVAEAVVFLLRQPRRAWTQELNLWPF